MMHDVFSNDNCLTAIQGGSLYLDAGSVDVQTNEEVRFAIVVTVT